MWVLLFILAPLWSNLVTCNEMYSAMDDKHSYDVINDISPSSSNIPVAPTNFVQLQNDAVHNPDVAEDASFLKNDRPIVDLPPIPPTVSYLPPVPPPPPSSTPAATQPSHNLNLEHKKHLNDVLQHEDRLHVPRVVTPEQNMKVYIRDLNPQEHSRCEPKELLRIVTHAHCHSKEMNNSVCVGSCLSYSVPQTEPETPGDELLDYCDSCQPQESRWKTVELDCEEDGTVYKVTKNIQDFVKCSCSSCRQPRRHGAGGDALHRSWNEHSHLQNSYLLHQTEDSSGMNLLKGSEDEILQHKLRTNSDQDTSDLRKQGSQLEGEVKQMTLRALREKFKLNERAEDLLQGKSINVDVNSFIDTDEDGLDDEEESINII